MADQTFGQSSVQHMSIQTRFFNLQHWLKYIPGNRYTHPSLQFTVLSQLCKIVKQHHSTNEKKSLQKKLYQSFLSKSVFFCDSWNKDLKKICIPYLKNGQGHWIAIYTWPFPSCVIFRGLPSLSNGEVIYKIFLPKPGWIKPLTINASPNHSQKCPSSFTLCIKMYWIQYSSNTAFLTSPDKWTYPPRLIPAPMKGASGKRSFRRFTTYVKSSTLDAQ